MISRLGVILALSWCHALSAAQETITLVGVGSSVPAPLYSKWTQAYNKRNPKIQVQYIPLGTSEGIEQLEGGNRDFGAGEAPLTARQRSEGGLLELPGVVIGIVPIYNVPGVRSELSFSGEVLAEIFLGRVKRWNDSKLAQLNPGVALPDLPIKVFYRPAGKGSNYVFTEFLSQTSPIFRSEIGVSLSPKWPVGIAVERSWDMGENVKTVVGSLGYVEAQYAIKLHIPNGRVLNPSGQAIRATPENIAAACSAVEAPRWDQLFPSLTNAAGQDSYPISSFSWLYVRTSPPPNPKRDAALVNFLNWIYDEGQELAAQEGYVELAKPLLAKVKTKIATLPH